MTLAAWVLLVSASIVGMPTFGRAVSNVGTGPSLAPAALFACDTSRAVDADFDENGVSDRVAVHDSEQPSLQVVFNGSRQIVLARNATCRLGLGDVDHDADVDLLVVNPRGDLLIWRNEHGMLRRVEPKPAARVVRGRVGVTSGKASSHIALHANSGVGVLQGTRHVDGQVSVQRLASLPITWPSLLLHPRWLARPPPTARSLA